MIIGRREGRGHRIGPAGDVLRIEDVYLMTVRGLGLCDSVGIVVSIAVGDSHRLVSGRHADKGDDQVSGSVA